MHERTSSLLFKANMLGLVKIGNGLYVYVAIVENLENLITLSDMHLICLVTCKSFNLQHCHNMSCFVFYNTRIFHSI